MRPRSLTTTPWTIKVLSLIAHLHGGDLFTKCHLLGIQLSVSYQVFQDHDLFFSRKGQKVASTSGHINDDRKDFKNTIICQLP